MRVVFVDYVRMGLRLVCVLLWMLRVCVRRSRHTIARGGALETKTSKRPRFPTISNNTRRNHTRIQSNSGPRLVLTSRAKRSWRPPTGNQHAQSQLPMSLHPDGVASPNLTVCRCKMASQVAHRFGCRPQALRMPCLVRDHEGRRRPIKSGRPKLT